MNSRKIFSWIGSVAFLVGLNVGFVKVAIFLYHQWGWLGVAACLTFVPPIIGVPIWEWVSTGHFITFVLVYVVAPAGLGIAKAFAED